MYLSLYLRMIPRKRLTSAFPLWSSEYDLTALMGNVEFPQSTESNWMMYGLANTIRSLDNYRSRSKKEWAGETEVKPLAASDFSLEGLCFW